MVTVSFSFAGDGFISTRGDGFTGVVGLTGEDGFVSIGGDGFIGGDGINGGDGFVFTGGFCFF